MSTNELSKTYIDTVCSHIKCREVHEDIKLELQSHFDDIVAESLAEGLSPSEANEQAIRRLGDPSVLGKQLHLTHKPRTEWGIIGSMIFFLILGVLVMLSIGKSHSVQGWLSEQLIWRKIESLTIGLALATGLFFWDYRKLSKYSKWIYGATLAVSVLQLLGVHMNGRPVFGFWGIQYQLNFIGITPVVFLIAIAGLFAKWDWNRKYALAKAWLLLLAPLVVFNKSMNSFTPELEYLVGFIVLMVSSKAKREQWLNVLIGSVAGSFCFLWLNFHQHIDPLISWLHPFQNPQTTGYQLVQSITAIRTAGFFGQGFSSSLTMLAAVQTDFVFAYLTYAFGWLAGGLVVVLSLYLISRLVMTSKLIRDQSGRLIVNAISAYFTIQFLWSILMCLGYAPPASVSLPFVAHGGVQMVVQMVAVGMVLGIYRRKDMVRASI